MPTVSPVDPWTTWHAAQLPGSAASACSRDFGDRPARARSAR